MSFVREKLVDLLTNSPQLDVLDWTTGWEEAANYLIAHGVTVQEWISVEDRLPEEDGVYLVFIGRHQYIDMCWFATDGEYKLGGRKYAWYFYNSEFGNVPVDSVSHWMPLPQTPKGEKYEVD